MLCFFFPRVFFFRACFFFPLKLLFKKKQVDLILLLFLASSSTSPPAWLLRRYTEKATKKPRGRTGGGRGRMIRVPQFGISVGDREAWEGGDVNG